jgi:hypothetical protein
MGKYYLQAKLQSLVAADCVVLQGTVSAMPGQGFQLGKEQSITLELSPLALKMFLYI